MRMVARLAWLVLSALPVAAGSRIGLYGERRFRVDSDKLGVRENWPARLPEIGEAQTIEVPSIGARSRALNAELDATGHVLL